MIRMTAVGEAVLVLEREGITVALGAAINPLYAALRKRGAIRPIVARHVEGASHTADGYSCARPATIGVCIGTSGPAGIDMITRLCAATADSSMEPIAVPIDTTRTGASIAAARRRGRSLEVILE
jgi:tartronate-semialdehyde synthase